MSNEDSKKFGYQPQKPRPGGGRDKVDNGYQPERSQRSSPTQRPTPPKKG